MASSRDLFVSVFAAPLVAVFIALPVFVRLIAVPDQHPQRQWLVEEPSTFHPRPLPLAYVDSRDGADFFSIPLTTPDLAALLDFDEISIVLGNEFTDAILIDASLLVDGTSCRYATAPRTMFENNQLLWLVRGTGCEVGQGSSARNLELIVRLVRGTGRVAIWTFEDPTSERRLLYAPPYHGKRVAIRGQAGRMPRANALSRAQLIAAVWDSTPTAIWTTLAIAFLAVIAGITLLHISDSPGRWRLPLAAAGTALSLSGLALVTATIVPPLQAPDEPDHLLTFGVLTGRAELTGDVPALARRTHFERIRHQYAQHFRSEDIGRPWPLAWAADAVHIEPMADRSPLTVWWWRLQSALTSHNTDAFLLLRLRQNNAILLGIVAAIAVLILGAALPDSRPALTGLWMLVIPVLPFYGMSMTDTPVILTSTVLYAVAVVAVVLDTRRGPLAGLALGAAMTAVLLSGRRAWPLLLAGLFVLLARAFLGAPAANRRQTLWFWATLTLTLGLGLWWATSLGMFANAIDLISHRRPELSKLAAAALGRAWMFAPLLLVLAAIDLMSTHLRRQMRPIGPTRLWKWIGGAGALAILAPVMASRFIAFPTTNAISVLSATASTYVAAVMTSMAVPFRLAHFDLLLSTLFWAGFGWSDTVPREWLIASLCAATAAMLAWTWWQAGWSGQPRRLILLGSLFLGLGLALAGTALGAYALQYDLYGRYLLGWYVLLIAIAWTAPIRIPAPAWLIWAAPVFLVHTYCLQLIAIRYF